MERSGGRETGRLYCIIKNVYKVMRLQYGKKWCIQVLDLPADNFVYAPKLPAHLSIKFGMHSCRRGLGSEEKENNVTLRQAQGDV